MNVVLAISDKWINLNALWKICVIGLIAGAGLPIIFAIGLRLLSLPAKVPARWYPKTTTGSISAMSGGAIGAGVCFAIVLAAIGLGIYWIVEQLERITVALPAFLQKVLDWLHAGYPEGVPQTGLLPLAGLPGPQPHARGGVRGARHGRGRARTQTTRPRPRTCGPPSRRSPSHRRWVHDVQRIEEQLRDLGWNLEPAADR